MENSRDLQFSPDGECPIHGTVDAGCDHPRMADPTGPRAGTCEECGDKCACEE